MGKDQDLLQAVKEQDVQLMHKILNKNKASKKLIGSNKKLNVNFQDEDGMAALHQAALVGNVEIMHTLIEAGATVDVRDKKGMRPLHYASWQGKEEPVQLLLQNHSSTNEAACEGETPLHLACQHGHYQVVKLLLNYHSDPTLENSSYKTPLDLACEFGRFKVVELLVQTDRCGALLTDSRNLLDNGRTSCLHLAAKNGHSDIIRLLLQAGVSINLQTAQGTCLHEAALYGKLDVVRLLLECGADVNRPNSYDQTPLDIVNKFTGSRAAKELKQLLKDASYAVHAQAVEDYNNLDDQNFLTFREGDYITVLEQRPDGIWRGYVNAEGQMAKTGYFPASAVMLVDRQRRQTWPKNQWRPYMPRSVLNRGLKSPAISPLSPDHQLHEEPTYYHSHAQLNNGHYIRAGRDDQFPPPPSPLAMSKSSSHESDSWDSGISPQQPHPQLPFPGQSLSPVRQHSPGLSDGSEWVGRHDREMHSFGHSRDSPLNSKRNSAGSSGSGGTLQLHNAVNLAVTQQHRLSGQSYESGVSGVSSRQSYHSGSSSSLGSLDRLEESGYSSTVNVHELFHAGLPDSEIIRTWLSDLHYEDYYHLFIQAGYDMPTISRMTPEDLTAIGITKPAHRKRLKSEISKLHIHDGIPDHKPADLMEWLQLLNLPFYYDTLMKQSYNMGNVNEITWEDLEEIGIKKLGHQKKIMLAIDRLKRIESGQKRMSTLERRGSTELLEAAQSSPSHTSRSSSMYNAHHSPDILSHKPPLPLSSESGSGDVRSFSQNDRPSEILHMLPPKPGVVYQPDVIAIQVQQGARGSTQEGPSPDAGDLRESLTYQSFHGPLDGESGTDNSSEGSGTLQRPSAVVSPRPKPKPVAKIIAKTKRASCEIPADIMKPDKGDPGSPVKGDYGVSNQGDHIYESPDEVIEQSQPGVIGYKQHSTPPPPAAPKPKLPPHPVSHYSSPVRTKKPPPPPKRTNSIKNDIRGLIEQARAATQGDKAGPKPQCQPGPRDDDDDDNIESPQGSEDFPPPPPSLECTSNPILQNPLSDVIEQLEQQTFGLSSGKERASTLDRRTLKHLSHDEPQSNLLAASTAQTSCSTDTLPFANENVGTIKQKNPTAKPSIVTVNGDDDPSERSLDLNQSMFAENSGTIRRMKPVETGQLGGTSQKGAGADARRVPPPTPKRRDSIRESAGGHEHQPTPGKARTGESGDVLNEIDSMLQGLTDELDAMLESDLTA